MPFTALALTAAILVGYARGGRLRRVADSEVRASGALFAGLAVQLAVDVGALRGYVAGTMATVLLAISFVLVALWIVANRYRPGIPLIALGLLANSVVVIANGGMPVDPDAIAAAGLPLRDALHGKHTLLTSETRLALLADIIPIPVLRSVISVGDVVLTAGLIPFVSHLMTYEPAAERRGGSRSRSHTGGPSTEGSAAPRGTTG